MQLAHTVVDPRFPVGRVQRSLFGAFVEHMGRGVYTGLYEPSHATADEDGFRKDVLELVRELGVTTVRYPGGNYSSAYRWEDTVGPVGDRPRRIDLAWRSIETNEFGLDEFARWCRKTDIEPMMAVNLGTRGVHEAVDVLEYSNIPGGTALSDQRRANGSPEPHGIRMWCLGNEMDGPWQTGHKTAREYARIAAETARAMRQAQSDLVLVACGSSGPEIETFGEWEYEVLSECYDLVDYISLHYYAEEKDGDLASFLGSATQLDRYIADTIAAADAAGARRKSTKRIQLSLDEWNVWYAGKMTETSDDLSNWPVAPRIAEDEYSAADAVVVGDMLVTMIRHADRLTAASLAQLVNVIGAIRTEPGGESWRQTIFYPFALAARHARGESLRLHVDTPKVTTDRFGEIDALDAAATWDAETGEATVLVVNRSTDTAHTFSVDVAGLGETTVTEAMTLSADDPYLTNDREHPYRVVPVANDSAALANGRLTIDLPAVSWTIARLASR